MLSAVIPVYNEAESLTALHTELAEVADRLGDDLEILFVDDGSRDHSWGVIRELAEHDARIRAIRFRRNFGKASALSAGFGAAQGRVVFTLDADLQDDPAELPSLLGAIDGGLDVVSGWKKTRHDPWHKVGPSRVFNWLVSRMTGCHLHDHNCGLKAYRAEVLGEVEIYGELHRFIPVLAHARGFQVGELEVRHRPRKHGYSKYGMARFVKGLLDLLTVRFLTGFRQRPLHVLGAIGLTMLFLGAVGLLYLAFVWLDPANRPIGHRPLLVYSAALMGVGTQFLCLGVLAELITSYHVRERNLYSIREVLRVAPKSSDDSARNTAFQARD